MIIVVDIDKESLVLRLDREAMEPFRFWCYLCEEGFDLVDLFGGRDDLIEAGQPLTCPKCGRKLEAWVG